MSSIRSDAIARDKIPTRSERRTAFTIDFILQRFAAPERYDLWPQAHLHTQWPGNAKAGDPVFDQFVAREVPGILSFAQQQQLNSEGLVALLDRIGPAILLTHSQSGAFGWPVADARPRLVKGLVAVEPSGPPVHDVLNHGAPNWFSDEPALKTWGLGMVPLRYSPALTDPAQLAFVRQDRADAPGLVRCWLQAAPARTLPNLAQVPIVMIQSEASYHAAYDHCTDLYLTQAGVKQAFIHLVDRGIHGNGHMMMIEKNNDAIASVIADWLDHTIHPPSP